MFFKKRRLAKQQRLAELSAKELRKAEERHHWVELFDRAEAGDAAAQDEIIDYCWGPGQRGKVQYSDKLPLHVQTRYSAVKQLYDIRFQNSRTTKLLANLHQAESLLDRIAALVELQEWRNSYWYRDEVMSRLEQEFSISWDDLKSQLCEAVLEHHQELLPQRGTLDGFEELWEFINRTRTIWTGGHSYTTGDLREVKVPELPYPDDWNDLLALHYDTPDLKDFHDLPDRDSGDVLLLADQAVETNDLTQAQIALAYCNDERQIGRAHV